MRFITTSEILLLPDEEQEKLRREIENIYLHAFPKMSCEERDVYTGDYFKKPGKNFSRYVLLFRHESGNLIASAIFDYGEILCKNIVINGIYIISRAVLPEYQKDGLGKTIAKTILSEFQPDMLFTTCAQSPSLHSWLGLIQKGFITGYDVYPRLDERGTLITIPSEELDMTIGAFKQIYLGIVENKQEDVDKAVRNLTGLMVRKDIYGEKYDFDSWEKDGREDKLAKSLGLTNKDGILVILKKRG